MIWLNVVSEFRQSPERYLVSKNVTEEQFIIDTLQAVCSDSVSDEDKCHIFILLQEYAEHLFTNDVIIEQAVVSLEDIFQQCRVNWSNSRHQLVSHILATITTILIVKDQFNNQVQLFRDFVNILLDVISQVNTIKQCLVRKYACQCLEEIELNYPGVLRLKVDHLYQMCQLERTIVNQEYTSLYTTVLKNTVSWVADNDKCTTEQYLSETLHDRREPLKPLFIPEDKEQFMIKPFSPEIKRIPDDVDITELKKLVSAILDNSQFWTASKHFRVLRNLSEVVLQVPRFPPTIFTQQVLRFMSTSDLPLFHVVVDLQLKFGNDILTDNDDSGLGLECLLSNLHHPSADIGQRLMMFEWLLHYPNEKRTPKDACIPAALDYTQYASLFPTVFDGIDTTVKKMDVLSLCFVPGENADSACAILISSLMTLHKPVHYGAKGRLTAGLFKILYMLYCRHPKTFLVTEIQKLCLNVFLEQPSLAPYILDFIQNIKKFDSESALPIELLTSIMDQIVSLDSERLFPDVNDYLQLVRRAVMEPSIKPQIVMTFLTKLSESVDEASLKDWSFGLKILQVSQTLLLQHGSTEVFLDMANLLILLIKSGDIDVQAQAEISYNLLMTVSGTKVSSILPKPRETMITKNQNFSSIDMLSNHQSYPPQSPCTQVEPVIKLERIKESYKKFEQLEFSNEGVTQGTLTIQLPLLVSLLSDENLFSIEIEFDSDQFSDIKSVYIPALNTEGNNPVLNIDFVPINSLPGKVQARAIFTTDSMQQHWCSLPDIDIKFRDMFLPLHADASNASFSEVWQNLEERQSNDPTCCMSLFSTPNRDCKLQRLVSGHFFPFLCKSDSNLSETLVGIFLPPHSHLLLKMKTIDENIIVTILTDDLATLPSTCFFLEHFLK